MRLQKHNHSTYITCPIVICVLLCGMQSASAQRPINPLRAGASKDVQQVSTAKQVSPEPKRAQAKPSVSVKKGVDGKKDVAADTGTLGAAVGKTSTTSEVQLAQHMAPIPEPESIYVDELDPALIEDGSYFPVEIESGCDACGVNSPCGCDSCGYVDTVCGCRPRWWFGAEYVNWWADTAEAPPLFTTSPAGTAIGDAGVLDTLGTTVLFGGGDTIDSSHSGVRLTLGTWFGIDGRTKGEVSYFGFGSRSESFNVNSATTPIIARPIVSTATGLEASSVIAHPDLLTGSASLTASSELYGLELNFQRPVNIWTGRRFEFLMGYRYMNLEDDLRLASESEFTVAQGQVAAGTTSSMFDQFNADNRFHGFQFGLEHFSRRGPWELALTGKLGIGRTRSTVLIDGGTTNTVPTGQQSTFVGGLLAQSTNIGSHRVSEDSLVPEFKIVLTRQLNPCWKFTLGYTLLNWNNVMQAADQIDRQVSQFPPEAATGTLNPSVLSASSDYLLQGYQVGLLGRF